MQGSPSGPEAARGDTVGLGRSPRQGRVLSLCSSSRDGWSRRQKGCEYPACRGDSAPGPALQQGGIPTGVEGGRSSLGRRLLAHQPSLPSSWPLAAKASPSTTCLQMGTAEHLPARIRAAVSWYCLLRCPGSPVLPAALDWGQ